MKMGIGMGVVMCAAWAVIGAPAAAQSASLGIRGGIASSSVSWSPTPLGDELEGLARREAFTGGLWLALPVAGRVGFRGELVLVGRGFEEVTDQGTTSLSVGYVEVPVAVTVALAPQRAAVVPELFAGGWWARETGCDVTAKSDSVDATFDCDALPDGPVLRHETDFGLTVGAAMRVRLGERLRGLVDARYSAGLRNIDRSPEVDNFDIRHRSFSMSVGLGIDLGG